MSHLSAGSSPIYMEARTSPREKFPVYGHLDKTALAKAANIALYLDVAK